MYPSVACVRNHPKRNLSPKAGPGASLGCHAGHPPPAARPSPTGAPPGGRTMARHLMAARRSGHSWRRPAWAPPRRRRAGDLCDSRHRSAAMRAGRRTADRRATAADPGRGVRTCMPGLAAPSSRRVPDAAHESAFTDPRRRCSASQPDRERADATPVPIKRRNTASQSDRGRHGPGHSACEAEARTGEAGGASAPAGRVRTGGARPNRRGRATPTHE